MSIKSSFRSVIANKLEDLSINEGVECSDQTMASCFAVVARQQCAFYLAGITSIDLLALQKIDYTLRSLEH